MSFTRRRSLFGAVAAAFVAIAIAAPQFAHAAAGAPADGVTIDQITLADGKPVTRNQVTVTPQISRFRPAAAYPAATPAGASVLSPRFNLQNDAPAAARIVVNVTLRDDQPVPRFPSLVVSEAPDSPHNLAARSSAAQLVTQLKSRNAADYAAWRGRIAALGGSVRDEYWLVKGFTAELPLGAVGELARNPQVRYVEPNGGVRLAADGDAGNDLVVARTLLGTDPFRPLTRSTDRIALIDSGVNAHVLNNGVLGSVFDDTGETPASAADLCNHGTRSVAALAGNSSQTDQFRGVTSMKVDVYKWIVGDSVGCKNGTQAGVVAAIQHAVANLEKVLVLPLGAQDTPDSSMSVAADNAFDAGAVVVAASGNQGQGAGTVAAPGNARKVIAVGAVDVETFALQPYVGQGPTPDGRIKPDVVAPTNYETASGSSSTAMGIYTGTSAASAVAGGAAADLWTFLRGNNPTVDPGFVYSGLIAGGGHPFPFGNDEGAGKLKLPAGGSYSAFPVTVQDGQITTVPVALNQPGCRVTAAIWWPEQPGTHNDVDLTIVDPSGTAVASSTSGPSVFELARAPSATAGTWKFQFKGFRVPSGSQTVYATVTTCR
jgi:serine protease AprX